MPLARSTSILLALAGFSATGLVIVSPVQAQLKVALDQPNQFYNTSSGAKTLIVTGIIQNNTLDPQAITSSSERFPYTSSYQPLSNKMGSGTVFIGAPTVSRLAPGAIYSGALFDIYLDETTKPGVYDLGVGTGTLPDIPCFYEVQGHDTATGQYFDERIPFIVTVTTPVPEASTTFSLGLLLALGLGGVVLAAKRKKSAPAS